MKRHGPEEAVAAPPTTRIRTGGPEDALMICAILTALQEPEEDLSYLLNEYKGDLDPIKVKAGMVEELKRLNFFEVYDRIVDWKDPTSTRGGSMLRRRNEELGEHVRSRIVAREYANEILAELFAGTPSSVCFWFMLMLLACNRERVAMAMDAVSAFYQAEVTIEQVVKPPKNVEPSNVWWKLKRAMPGLRRASRFWQDFVASLYVDKAGCKRHPVEPCMFWHEETDAYLLTHGDDTLVVGSLPAVEKLAKFMKENLHCNCGSIIGPTMAAKELRFLKRTVRSTASGWEYEGDPKHAETLLMKFNMEDARAAPSPGKQEVETEELAVPLTPSEHAEYRSGAGLLQYMAEDRYDLKYATKELLRDASAPARMSHKKLKRIVR